MTRDEIAKALIECIARHDIRASETHDVAAPMYVGELHRMHADIYRDALRLIRKLDDA